MEKILLASQKVNGADRLLEVAESGCKIMAIILARKQPDHPRIAQYTAFASMVSSARMVFRLFGFPQSLASVFLVLKEKDRTLRLLTLAKIISIGLYFPLENVYLLAANKVFPKLEPYALPCMLVACRCWFLYIVFDMLSNYYKLSKAGKDKEKKEAAKTGLTAAYLDFPRAVHYSLIESPFHPIIEPIFAHLSALYSLSR
mmetsp:Transcript_20433/g.28211  ORF Transcript_20433/g.28211 Transcript_20433/m.28211 type:complete len:201 (+) Transcript_20433:71-673(+)